MFDDKSLFTACFKGQLPILHTGMLA